MHAQTDSIAAILGMRETTTPLELAEHCEKGLPAECLNTLARAFAPNEQAFIDSFAARSTLRRRRQRGHLTAEESDSIVRLACAWLMALQAFRSEEKARRFLHSKHPLLRGRSPLGLAKANTAGLEAVEQVLGRLKFGSAA